MSNHPISKLGRTFDYIVDVLAYTAGCAMILIILFVSAEVFSRTFFNRPILGIAEMAEYLLLYMTFLGATWVQKHHAHVSMDIMVERLRPKPKTLLSAVTSFSAGLVLLVISFHAVVYAHDAFQHGVHTITPLEFPKAILVGIVSIGCFTLSIQFFRDCYRAVTAYKRLVRQD